ncbi:PREDICTED: interferon lambda-3 [Elephantulus edwardii]|uniref:interferon lambda-3 n=1 Tax=Elephantulus edwardii TaxID=28737 RepID=UPI0003F0C6AF|nr:PREDICTED: interferon lambda-3 [Elephantulus edwardii]
MKLDKAQGCLLVLTLMAMLTRTGAGPTPTLRALRGALWNARDCHLGPFKSLSPQELQAFKRAKDAMEESLLLKNWTCSSRLFPKTWNLRQLQVWERPVALEVELSLTLKVLGNVINTTSTLRDILSRPLHTLRHIHSELQACILAQPTADPRPRGRLHRWLHRLQEVSKKESSSCLEASVTFNLFRLLVQDLKCVASGDQCV